MSRERLEQHFALFEEIGIRASYEDELADEFPEYADFMRRRANRGLELTGAGVPGEEIDRIMAEEGYLDEKWEPIRWRREHTK